MIFILGQGMEMKNEFRASVYTSQNIGTPHTGRGLWRVLDDPLIEPRRFGSTERAPIDYTPQNFNSACKIYSAEGILFVRGARNNFKAMFSELDGTLAKWTFWWSLDATAGPSYDQWPDWLCRLSADLPPHYGFACSVAEYEAKHKVVEADETGSSVQMAGVSAADFLKFLPGIYWLTIFGKDLAGHFDLKLQSLPGVQHIGIPPSQVAMMLESPAVPASMKERLDTEARLVESLGAQHFFDHARNEGEYAPVSHLLNLKG
ncbi:hypothetical protein [Streptomyces sp. NPDC015350]|uniref:hypothetical protein n=1 Tax=Streptomyces sp. NPDC015350 TaxID=3364955 RepID=UPI0036FBC9E2